MAWSRTVSVHLDQSIFNSIKYEKSAKISIFLLSNNAIQILKNQISIFIIQLVINDNRRTRRKEMNRTMYSEPLVKFNPFLTVRVFARKQPRQLSHS